jgi:hypothetical protein
MSTVAPPIQHILASLAFEDVDARLAQEQIMLVGAIEKVAIGLAVIERRLVFANLDIAINGETDLTG